MINEIPAKVCSVCGDVLLLPETVRSMNTHEQRVTCILASDGQPHVVEDVPARVNLETGEQLFAPATVEQLQRLIWQHKQVSLQKFARLVQYAASSAATA